MNGNCPDFVTSEMIAAAAARREGLSSLGDFGILVSRYRLSITLFLIGLLKFTAAEARN